MHTREASQSCLRVHCCGYQTITKHGKQITQVGFPCFSFFHPPSFSPYHFFGKGPTSIRDSRRPAGAFTSSSFFSSSSSSFRTITERRKKGKEGEKKEESFFLRKRRRDFSLRRKRERGWNNFHGQAAIRTKEGRSNRGKERLFFREKRFLKQQRQNLRTTYQSRVVVL